MNRPMIKGACALLSLFALSLLDAAYGSPVSANAEAAASKWDSTLARGKTRDIDFVTTEGTWMSADLSPDGTWIAFDLLGQIYRMPAAGGEAAVLTQDSGVAVNFQPRISPDGRSIAFISDRGGQYNLWAMNADGSNPRAIVSDLNVATFEPTWTPDGAFLIVRRRDVGNPGAEAASSSGLWIYHKDGGVGVQLVANHGVAVGGKMAAWPSVSGDGKHLYYQVGIAVPDQQPLSGAYQIRRFAFQTGETLDITAGEDGDFSSGGGVAPEISPNGRWLAFARQIPDGLLSFKGHSYGPRTALWLRDMKSGAERVLMDPIEPMVWSGMKTVGILPRYRWAPDSNSVLITQGGKLRRVNAMTGDVATIPFSAKVHRTISEMARKEIRITDTPFDVKFFRWPSTTADGKKLVFQAVGRIYVQDGPHAAPHRLTSATFAPLEFAPTWSPDGRWLAFVTWDDGARGQLWKVAATGGAPRRLSKEPGEYTGPVWSPDGKSVVVLQGSGATARQRTLAQDTWFDVMSFPANAGKGGSEGTKIVTITRPSGANFFAEERRQLPRLSFGPEGRIFWPEEIPPTPQDAGKSLSAIRSALVSVKPDGSDRRESMTFPYADEIVPSPDGRWVAFQEGDNVYVTPMAWGGIGGKPQEIAKHKGQFPVTALTQAGGLFPHWRDKTALEYGSGAQYFVHHMDTGLTDTVVLALRVPKDVPQGSLALTNARIVPLNHGQVIESGTIVVKGSRIACVGACNTDGIERIIDARGKTIIPGFVDAHAHHNREWRGIGPKHDYEQAVYLAYGVTTTLDPSTYSVNVFPTAELIEAGEMIGPREFSTGDPLLRSDSGRSNEIATSAGALNEVKKLAGWGAITIKQYVQPRRDQRQWLAEAARQMGMNETSEGEMLFETLGVVMDGQTGWEHSFGELPMYSDAAKFFGQAHVTFSPTLMVGGPSAWNEGYWYGQSDVWKDEKVRRWLPWRTLVAKSRVRWLRPDTDYSYSLMAQAMADVIAAGGWGAMGAHGQFHGLGDHWEVWMGASALGNMGALEVASMHGAHFLGIDHDVGSIEVGKLADLVVLNSNPLEDIKHTADIKYVLKAGKVYDAMSMDEIWPKTVPFGPYYWVNDEALQNNTKASDVFDKQ